MLRPIKVFNFIMALLLSNNINFEQKRSEIIFSELAQFWNNETESQWSSFLANPLKKTFLRTKHYAGMVIRLPTLASHTTIELLLMLRRSLDKVSK